MKSMIFKIAILSLLISITFGCGGGSSGNGDGKKVPSAPTGVNVSAGNEQVTISWSSVSNATSYNIYWSTTSGVTKTNGTPIPGVTNPYTHTGLTNEITCYYVVTAANSAGESSASSQVSAKPSLNPPPPPPG